VCLAMTQAATSLLVRKLVPPEKLGTSTQRTLATNCAMKIHTSLPAQYLQARIDTLGPWFYEFEFDNRVRTNSFADQNALGIHESRVQCILPVLDRYFAGRWREISCLDVACHEGWFTFQIAQRGVKLARGVDIRPDRIERANLIKEAGAFTNVDFEVRDLFTLSPPQDGVYDLTLFLGVFYHLEDPVRGIRAMRSLTRNVCVIEGQVARFKDNITTAWGSQQEIRSGPACAVVDADPQHTTTPTSISLVPSLEALKKIIRAAGFQRVELVEPGPSLHEQYINSDRVILFAFA
jgi:tRNA (mo5U34)-methyltransferase